MEPTKQLPTVDILKQLLNETSERLKNLAVDMDGNNPAVMYDKFHEAMKTFFIKRKLHKIIRKAKNYKDMETQLRICAVSDRGYTYPDKDSAQKNRAYRAGFIECFLELVREEMNNA